MALKFRDICHLFQVTPNKRLRLADHNPAWKGKGYLRDLEEVLIQALEGWGVPVRRVPGRTAGRDGCILQ